MKLQIACSTARGAGKPASDDSALLGDKIANDESVILEITTPAIIALCDGVGGNAGGRDASLFVCEKLRELDTSLDDKNLRNEVLRINTELLGFASNTPGKGTMATTLTGVIFGESGTYLIHAGNTRLYTLKGGFIQQLTDDHTTYQWLKSTGQTDIAEYCNKSEIRCALGGGSEKYARLLEVTPIFERRMPKRILLTTDGVHDIIQEGRLEELMNEEFSSIEKAIVITDEALNLGSTDDRSAVIVSLDNS